MSNEQSRKTYISFYTHIVLHTGHALSFLGTTDLQRLARAPHTITMSSKRLTWETGITECKILKLYHLLITLSTCILTRDSCLDESTSQAGN